MKDTNFSITGNILSVQRRFNAGIEQVWDAWTKAEILDQWWAPKPWKSETAQMEFKRGACRLYAMVGPEGEKHWARTDFTNIDPLKSFSGKDLFCDETGQANKDLPVADFLVKFSESEGHTEITMITEYPTEESLQQVLDMGMKEGLSMAFENLDDVLKTR